jgi:prevent-host-death family protein
MKTVSVRELQKDVKGCVDAAQKGRVVVTRHGKPALMLVGVEGEDWEDIVLQSDPEFWKMIRERRAEKSIPMAEVEKRLRGLKK